MAWVKLDDAFFRNSKVMEAGKDGRALYLAGLCFCASQLTDGLISRTAVRVVGAEAEVDDVATTAARLVELGLWEAGSAGSYVVHDYLDYNPSRERVLATRTVRAEAGRLGGEQRATNAHTINEANSQSGAKQIASQNAEQTIKQNQSKSLPRTPYTPAPVPNPDPDPLAAAHSAQTAREGAHARTTPRPATRARASGSAPDFAESVCAALGETELKPWEAADLATMQAAGHPLDRILSAVEWAKGHADNAAGIVAYARSCITDAPWLRARSNGVRASPESDEAHTARVAASWTNPTPAPATVDYSGWTRAQPPEEPPP